MYKTDDSVNFLEPCFCTKKDIGTCDEYTISARQEKLCLKLNKFLQILMRGFKKF